MTYTEKSHATVHGIVLRAGGTNCEGETVRALELDGMLGEARVTLAFVSVLLMLIYGPGAPWFVAGDRFVYDQVADMR